MVRARFKEERIGSHSVALLRQRSAVIAGEDHRAVEVGQVKIGRKRVGGAVGKHALIVARTGPKFPKRFRDKIFFKFVFTRGAPLLVSAAVLPAVV